MIYTVIDIESDGLSGDCEIYEFAYVRLDDNLNVIKSGTLYFWKKEWTLKAGEIHHLTKEFLEKHADMFYQNLAIMYATLHNTIVIGKNNMSFDNSRIYAFIARNMHDSGDKAIRTFQMKASVDVQNYMRPHFQAYTKSIGLNVGSRASGKLEEYMDMCGFTREILVDFANANNILIDDRFKAHGAMYDTLATLAVFKWLVYVKKTVIEPR